MLTLFVLNYWDPKSGDRRRWFTSHQFRQKFKNAVFQEGCGGFSNSTEQVPVDNPDKLVEWLNRLE